MIVDMEGICKDYPSDSGTVHALRDIDLKIEKGDYIAIMGPSGSGKTTLMNIIGFLDLPTSGTYLLDGVDETQSSEDKLAEVRNKHIGFVFQTFYLLPGLTAVENVALPLLYADVPVKERLERAKQALCDVGLEDRVSFYPRQLSGGQCQRVAIARAMVTRPQLLLADEPTGALDSTAGSQIMDIFRRLNDQGMTIVMITHEHAVARCANKIYNIFDGMLSEGNELSWESALAGKIADSRDLPASDAPAIESGSAGTGAARQAEDANELPAAEYERDEELESEYAAILEDEQSDELWSDDTDEAYEAGETDEADEPEVGAAPAEPPYAGTGDAPEKAEKEDGTDV